MKVIFTDLDGTLLHPETYSFKGAQPTLDLIRKKGIPLVLCSSKTRAEMELYRKRLNNRHPFIVENGSGVFVPRGYFALPVNGELEGNCIVVSFGLPYDTIRKKFMELRKRLEVPVIGFGDMTVEEIAKLTGLPRAEAALARKRDFSEPFVFEQEVDQEFLKRAGEGGLNWTRGKFYCLMGDHDKGRAVRLLKKAYEREHGKIITIGLGDASNDLPLLQEVDHPVLIPKRDGSFDPDVSVPGLVRAQGTGPAGWNQAVLALLSNT